MVAAEISNAREEWQLPDREPLIEVGENWNIKFFLTQLLQLLSRNIFVVTLSFIINHKSLLEGVEGVCEGSHTADENCDEGDRRLATEPDETNQESELFDLAQVCDDYSQPDRKGHPALQLPKRTGFDLIVICCGHTEEHE